MSMLFKETPIDKTEGLPKDYYVLVKQTFLPNGNFLPVTRTVEFNESWVVGKHILKQQFKHYLRPLPLSTVVLPHDLLMEIKGTLSAIVVVSTCDGSRQLASRLLTKLAQQAEEGV